MATVTRPRPRVKPSQAHAYSLALAIDHQVYAVEPIPAGECGTRAFRLAKKSDGAVYDVVRTPEGLVACDCPDYEARHRGLDCGCCKHGAALIALGLLDTPAPVALARPRAEEPAPTVPPPLGRVRDEFDEPYAPPAEDVAILRVWRMEGFRVELARRGTDRFEARTFGPSGLTVVAFGTLPEAEAAALAIAEPALVADAATEARGPAEPSPTPRVADAPRGRRMPFTASDLSWWVENTPTRAEGFAVVIPGPAPIRGGSPEADDFPARRPRAERGPMPRRHSTGLTEWTDADQAHHHGYC